jgi:hypothetical protein
MWRHCLRAPLLTTPVKRKVDFETLIVECSSKMRVDCLRNLIPGCAQNEKVLLSR